MSSPGKPSRSRKASLPGPIASPAFLEEALQYVNSPVSSTSSSRSSRNSVDNGVGTADSAGQNVKSSPIIEDYEAATKAKEQISVDKGSAAEKESAERNFNLFKRRASNTSATSSTSDKQDRLDTKYFEDSRTGSDEETETIGTTVHIPERDPEAVAHMAEQFKKFFSKRSSLGESPVSDDDTAWKPLASWASAVDVPKRPIPSSTQPILTFSNAADGGSSNVEEEFWAIRVFKPMDQLDSRLSSLVENSGHTFVTVACSLSTTAAELCRILSKKFSSVKDLERFRLFVIHNGTERLLSHEDRPVAMLKNWLEVIGYREGDQLQKVAREDHSYLCRFVFHEFPPAPPSSEQFEKGPHPRITARSAFLTDLNLSVVPVAVFRNAATLEYLDFSKNTLLDIPEDLFECLANLKLLRLTDNLLTTVPKAITRTEHIVHLDLSGNNLTGHSLETLKHCIHLTHLNLSGNQIDQFPEELSALTKIRYLDISGNYLSEFPVAVLKMTQATELNFAFNLLTSIPDEIERLGQLRVLSLTGNRVNYIPHSINQLVQLKQLDTRGNLLDELGGIAWISSALEISLSHNTLSKLEGTEWLSATQVLASHNQLSSVSLGQSMSFLKTLDLRVNKLITLPDGLFKLTPALQTLNLSRNMLTCLPSSINALEDLETLNISDNQIIDLCLDFSRLPRLVRLDAHDNNIRILPDSIWMAKSLMHLNLSSNFIIELPDPGFHFSSQPLMEVLEELYLAENNLVDESLDDIYTLTKLTLLNISHNQIFDLGDDISNLKNLTDLYVSGNIINNIPETIDSLQSLRRFFINGNRLSNIPPEVGKIPFLVAFDASSNNLKFNAANWPYDWNWNFNPELQYLDLANNKKFDLMPSSSGSSQEKYKDMSSFKSLSKLRLLNLTGLKPTPNFPEETITLRVRKTASDETIKVSTSDFCGRDNTFDKFDTCQKNFFDQENDLIIGFFDGQGSDVVSYYLKDSLAEAITYEVQRLKPDEEIPTALRRGFLACNRDLSMQPTDINEGATATVAYFMDNKLYVANVGDSMAVISRDGQAVIANEKHHGWNRNEQSRVRNLGGFISTDGLVERELQITRGFGYHHLLPFINVNPYIRTFEIGPHEEFVIIASQSFWKYVRYQVAVDIARAYRDHPEVAVQRLRDTAIAYGAASCLTVLFIDLKNFGAVQAAAQEISQNQQIERRRRIARGSVEDRTLSRLASEIDPPNPPCAFVFTDIRESTRLWEMDPNAMRSSNKIHNQLIRRLLRLHHGYEVKNEGDAFMVVFEKVIDALRWCKDVQEQLLLADWPQEILKSPICAPLYGDNSELLYKGLSVRMGIHYGAAINEQDIVTRRMDYFGVEVITASRVCDAALGGQIIVSSTVYNTAQASLKTTGEDLGLVFYEIGATKLKGIENFEVVYAVYPSELAGRFRQQEFAILPSEPPARL